MQNWIVGLTVALWTAGTFWHIWLLLTDQTKPALTAWIIMTTTMAMALISFWLAPKPSVAAGIGFIAGVGSTFLAFTALAFKTWQKKTPVRFNRFQKWMLRLTVVIVLIWIVLKFAIGGQHAAFVANLLTQVLMTVGYVALAERLWHAETRIESLFFWTTICVGGTLTIIPASMQHNILGIIYGIRTFFTAGITVVLLLRIKVRPGAITLTGASAT